MAKRLLEHLKLRVALVVATAGVAWAWAMAAEPAPEATRAGVAAMLSRATGVDVAPEGFIWEPSGGSLRDAATGRRVFFLGRTPAGRRDVYRASVRVSHEGLPLSVGSWRNLTRTPGSDEGPLINAPSYLAFPSRDDEGFLGVTVYGLDEQWDEDLSWWSRWVVRLDNVLDVGTLAGLRRSEVVLRRPAAELDLQLRDHKLVLAMGSPPRAAALDLTDGTFTADPKDEHDAQGWVVPRRRRPLLHVGMDALRATLGTETADRIKGWLFRFRGRWVAAESGPPAPEPKGTTAPTATDDDWPPAPIPPRFAHPLEQEGQWRPPDEPVPAWPKLAVLGPAQSPPLLQTEIRPRADEPFARVKLVAIDTRRLDLHIEAGFDEPRPVSGPRGRGRIPDRDRDRTVAAFNGAFQTRHGHYGMMVRGRLLVPPVAEAATIAVDVYGRPRLGNWRFGAEA
ncbi:MAG: hypothetical protein AAGA56_08565, partial [Myxococcota bacterium]